MRPVLVAVGAVVAALGGSALFDVYESARRDPDTEYREQSLGALYAGGFTLLGLALAAYGLLT